MKNYPAGFLQLWVDSYWTGTCEGLTVYPLGGCLVALNLTMDNLCTFGPVLSSYFMLDRPDALKSRG